MACLVAKPIVNGIEKDLKGTAEVIRLNLLGDVGQEAARRYRVSSVPATVLIAPDGQVALRQIGMPDRGEFVSKARAF
ncbi:hypothetical protein ABI59_17915 [Acidobacteria bacterium Mor1]|nr:hypothetical protein ABI59_17915 [Acidobacteria bacterium Mor1]